MPQIPLVQAPVPGQTPQVGRRAPAGMNDAAYDATARVGAAVAGLGDAMDAFTRRKQEAISYGQEMAARTAMNEVAQQFQQDLLKSSSDESDPYFGTDPKDPKRGWGARLGLAQKALDDRISALKIAPDVMQRITPQVNDWKSRLNLNVNQQLVERDISLAKGQVLVAAEQATNSGDVDGAIKTIRGGAERGLIEYEQAEKMIADVPRQVEIVRVKQDIASSPYQTWLALKDGKEYAHLSEADRLSLMGTAHDRSSAAATELKLKISSEVDAAQGDPTALEEIRRRYTEAPIPMTMSAAEYHGIKPQDIERMTKAKRDDSEAYVELARAVRDYSPDDDKSGDGRSKLMNRIAGETAGVRQADLIRSLNDKQDRKPENPAFKRGHKLIDDTFNLLVSDASKVAAATAARDNPDDEVARAKYATQQAERSAANYARRQAEATTLFEAWKKAHPDATDSEVFEAVNGFMGSNSARGAILRRAAAAGVSALPPARGAGSNGR